MPLPDLYADVGGRLDGATLWNLNHDAGVDEYIDKFILYGGYMSYPFPKGEWLGHTGLAILAPIMGRYESEQQDAPHFAANDGMVPLQSALYLQASDNEPIYATEPPAWFVGQDVPKKPLDLDIDGIEARLPLSNKTHYRLCTGFDHLDMVAGKGNLFSTIGQDLNDTVNSTPVADFTATVNGSEVTVDASGSYDRDTELWPASGSLKYRVDWDASNGLNWTGWSTSPDLQHTYGAPDTYTISLQVRDGDGMMSAAATAEVTVTPSGSGEVTPGEMVSIPAGSFEMGDPFDEGSSDELPVHTVTLSAYEIGKYEVTNQEYADILNWAHARGYLDEASSTTADAYGVQLLDVDDGDCQISYSGSEFVVESRDGYSMAEHPVVEVSWYGAAVYCNWLSESQGLQACYDTSTWECDFSKNGYHLPTEAQWERAAAWDSAQNRHYRYGNGSDRISSATVNYDVNNPLGLSNYPYTSPVGYYTGVTSPAGCFDMSGNVWEWCNDWYDSGYYSQSPEHDPHNASTGAGRVLRGGPWFGDDWFCRSADRDWFSPTSTYYGNGFRVVCVSSRKSSPLHFLSFAFWGVQRGLAPSGRPA